jgi:peptidyl-prolyl cis-trans isomerase SurA
MKGRSLVFWGCLAAALGAATGARATIVERIVAVVGDQAILLSDVRERAQPFLVQVYQSVPPGAQQNAAISQVYRVVLDRLVNEEVDDALKRVAAQNDITVDKLLREAQRTGMTEPQYRAELRRQLLEAKLINLRLQGRIRVTSEDLRAAYRQLVLEERQQLTLTPAWIVLSARGAPGEAHARAQRVAELAESTDFGALARRYSEDPSRNAGGVLHSMTPSELPPELARISIGLEVGETSPAIRVGDRFIVMKVMKRAPSKLPDFESAQRELTERVYMDKMAQAKKTWLEGLRRQHHVEIRF